MKLGRLLEKLGLWSDGVEEGAAARPAAEEKRYEKRVVSLESLREARAEAQRAMETGQAAARLGLGATPEEIYTAAGVPTPEHGWTLVRLAREVKAEDDVALVLAEHKVSPESLLEDGLKRDEALDVFEAQLDARVEAFLSDSYAKVGELEEQVHALREKIERLQSEQKDIRSRQDAWRAAKHAAEDEMERAAERVAALVKQPLPRFSEGRKAVGDHPAPWAAPGHAETGPRDLPPPHPAGWAPPVVPED